MKISLNWLKKFIEIKESPIELESILTEVGLEVDEVISIEPDKNFLNKLVVGEIISIKKHPNADRLNITEVSIGDKVLSIVCGAKNIENGQKVVVARSGTKIKSIENNIFEIKKTKIRGAESDGMICAEDEIGIGNSHSGVIVLEKKAKVGDTAVNHLNINSDTIYDISLTPNRADAASHLGVARDIKAVKRRDLKLPDTKKFKFSAKKEIKLEIKETSACPRYAGCVIDNIKIGESPSEIKNLLSSIGLNPINNVVDITNYVLHSLGQPLHAFDYEKVSKEKVIVRYANKNEKFITLDGVERKLHDDDLMICDGENKPMCIAGVFGGENSGVTDDTETIFLESAYFNPSDIRKSSLNHGLKTDASYRFERGIDPNITVFALKFASILINKYCNGEVVSEIYDIYPEKIENRKIEIDFNRINKLIGQELDIEEIIEILNHLDIKIEKQKNKTLADVPPYRVDVTREADIVEEILRVYGYNNIKTSSRNKSSFLSDESAGSYENNIISKLMSILVGSGFHEITTNSLTSLKHSRDDSWDDSETIEMVNKLSDEHAILKQNLLFTGLESIRYNLNRKQKNLKFFEFDKVYNKKGSNYLETKKLGIYMTGLSKEEHFNNVSEEVTFLDIKNIVNKILILGNIKNYKYKDLKSKTLTNSIELIFKKKTICKIGEVKQSLLKNFEISQKVYFTEILWENYLSCFDDKFTFTKISKFPEVKRDLSVILSSNKKFAEIANVIDQNRKKIIKNYSLYNIYEGDRIGKDKVAYALRFILHDESKTLEDKIINSTMENLISRFEKDLKAEIRK